jgi:hypothetical protein
MLAPVWEELDASAQDRSLRWPAPALLYRESAMIDPALTDEGQRPKPDASVPPPEICVLRPLLDRRATETPDKVFAKFADGAFWTYKTMRDITVRTAAALQALAFGRAITFSPGFPMGGTP